jgi:glycosyltransferase involved in cell wall biosynthesis
MDQTKPKIFVTIASYCDPELPRTLDNLLANARHPENLCFGICWQFDTEQPVDLSRFEGDARFKFSTHRIEESGGGSWARNIAQAFWEGEDYVLQIDSHMAFAPGWDASVVRMMRTLRADKPLLTMIAPLFRIDDKNGLRKRTDLGIRVSRLSQWRAQSGWTPWFDWGQAGLGAETRNRFLSGQFIFTLGKWTEEVRQDPEHYYWGEEFALALRSYTHGYDFFLPDAFVAWHMEHVKGTLRRHWEHGEDVVAAKNAVAFDRLRKLAYSEDPEDARSLGRYGLGSVRSRAQFERFAGIDLGNKRAHPDVFLGVPPNPITIASDDDWADCVTFEGYSNSAPPR